MLHDGVNIRTVAHFGRRRPVELDTALGLGAPPDFDGVICAALGCDRKYGLQWDHVDPVADDEMSQRGQPPTTLLAAPSGEDRTRPRPLVGWARTDSSVGHEP